MSHLEVAEEVEVDSNLNSLQRFARVPKKFSCPVTDRLQNSGHSSSLSIPFNLRTSDLPYLDRLQVLFPNSNNVLSKTNLAPYSTGTVTQYEKSSKN